MSGRSERLRVVAHELRSPVAALVALAGAARDLPPEGRAQLIQLAVAAGRDMERILADPELFSLRTERVDVGRLVAALASETVTVSVEGRPQARADPTRVRQALANLVANGLRHGSRVTLDVREGEGSVVVVDVADDGPGIDTEADPFARGVSGSGSTGLGLWLARSIAEAHGGSLEVVPGSGPGARLRLTLPSASVAG